MQQPIWIDKQEVLSIHGMQIAVHGGSEGLRDEDLLDSALGRPLNQWSYNEENCSLASLAAAYAFGIARNHPFVDGNKRTALVVSFSFLGVNGRKVTAGLEDRYLTFLGLAAGEITEEDLARWFEQHSEAAAL